MKKLALLLGVLALAFTFSLAEADMENDTGDTNETTVEIEE